jgi:pimeloyl-ACP methyl ester carboxylesterase
LFIPQSPSPSGQLGTQLLIPSGVEADDVAWLCAKLELTKPAVIGHSMGGNVVLKLAARYPGLPASIVLLDTVMLVPQPLLDPIRQLAQALKGPEYNSVVRQIWEPLFLASDEPE